MKIILADCAGYCYGVERALKLANEAAEKGGEKIYSLGPLIHNRHVVEKLREMKNIHPVEKVSDAGGGKLIIRAHGVSPDILAEAEKAGNEIINATCKFVYIAQVYARQLFDEGYDIIILGEKDHPEVIGLVGYAGGKAIVVENASQLPDKKRWKKAGIVVQTTQDIEKLKGLVSFMVDRCSELKIYNTICSATAMRQEAARETAGKCGIMLVLGDRQSGNTRRLAQICEEVQPKTFLIERIQELDPSLFEGVECVGVTAGASTPNFIIREALNWLESFPHKTVRE